MALLFFGFCMAPLVALTGLTVRAIENQTIDVARRHLTEQAKTFAMHLIDRLDVAAWELAHNASASAAPDAGDRWSHPWRWVVPESSRPASGDLGRPVLSAADDGFLITVQAGDLERTGFVSDEVLFANLGNAPFGVRSCVAVAGRVRRCAGEDVSGPVVRARWYLSLQSMYDTDVAIEVESTQSRALLLHQIGVLQQVLPYLVFAIMAVGGWWVLTRLRARFAPVAQLRDATERVQKGDYDVAVSIRSGDELEELGDAFNAMTRQLHASFTIMRALAEIDHMVLKGANLQDLLRQALVLLDDLALGGGVVWLWDPETGGSEVHRLDASRRLEKVSLDGGPAVPESVNAAVEALCQQGVPARGPRYGIMHEGALTGLIACAPASGRNDAGKTLEELGDRISVAVTSYGRARALFQHAHYDGLTGLLNREAFNDRLQRAIAGDRGEGTHGALVCLDLDRFKQINDTEGHHVGDQMLRRVAERLRRTVRASDEVARLGGDEFAVLVPRFDQTAEIEALCRRIMNDINQPVEIDGCAYVTEVSLGVAVFPDDGDDAAALMRKADVAMYKAKEQSGCAFTFFDGAMNRATKQRAQIEARLRQGLKSRELCLHFQPKVRVSDGRVVGVEGLLRWPSAPEFNPGVFIPVAEQTGLIHDFTRILVEDSRVCLERCREAGFEIDRVGINVSPRQFQRGGFAETLLETLARNGARPSDFEIEVTESIFVDDPRAVAADLTILRGAGVTVALDDFGTGYSSLNVLRELPLDVIKIDRSFVAPITQSAQARDLIGRIIDIVRSLGLTSVAEGVETEREMQILTAKQCHIVQGFLFSPALPVSDLIRFLEQRSRNSLSA